MLDALPPAMRRMAIGAGLMLLGAVLTGGGYLLASLGFLNGAYLVFGGLILWGGIYFVGGMGEGLAYLTARRSGDPWRMVPHDPGSLARLLPASIASDNTASRLAAVEHLPLASKLWQPEQIAPYFVAGLTDQVYGIQLAAYSALLATARENAAHGARALVAVINTLQDDEALTARLSGGRSTLDRLLLVGQDTEPALLR